MILWLLAACDPSPGETGAPEDTAPDTDSVVSFDETTDVLVIGAGPAGLSAAIEAENAGAHVVVLEREEWAGGAANWAGALMMFSGAPEELEAGIVDSPAQLTAEWPSFTGGDVTDPWFVYFAENNVPRVHDWLAGFGVTWTITEGDSSAGETPRILQTVGEGPALVAALLDQLPGDRLRYGATAEELLVSEGRVVGVRWADTGGEHTIGAGAVVVATGGFLHDLDRVRALFPDIDESYFAYASFTGADGSGLRMLENAGATTQNLQAVGFYAHGTMSPVAAGEEVVSIELGTSPWVNLAGARFADESEMNSFIVGRTRATQPGGDAWVIADTRFEEAEFMDPTSGELHSLVELENADIVQYGQSLDELADKLGVDTSALQATVDAWNESVAGHTVDPYRNPEADPGQPVLQPPYFAVPLAISAAKAFGGVEVDLQGRVLDTDGTVIPGVYAAGEVSGMAGGSLVGDYGFTGSLSAVVLSGRVAGENAGAEAVGL